MSEIKERPIIFSGPMVRAILEGRKTQTRRVVSRDYTDGFSELDQNYQSQTLPVQDIYWNEYYQKWWAVNTMGYPPRSDPSPMHLFEFDCPYGQPGDRLWVRETINGKFGCDAFYSADEASLTEAIGWDWVHKDNRKLPVKVIPSIHMPRWASRITLEITDVRVERLQDITEADAQAEGCKAWMKDGVQIDTARSDFIQLWEEINASRGYSWESNPFVWVFSFKVITPANSAVQRIGLRFASGVN